MLSRETIPETTYSVKDKVAGFEITAITKIQDIKALCYEGRHIRTGAEFIHLHCNDKENLFAIGFKTPPHDSTGLPHILEHSVLAGSKKYPLKDAFNELIKSSLNTFLNAMTWPDRTVYPVSSCIKADYYNLASVYADLVLNPLITENTFQREGHHYKLDDDGKLSISGVVYNEMKGAYSDPEEIALRNIMAQLLPETVYAHDSGGDPEVIPELHYDAFVDFHRKYYSASNSRTLFYGDCSLDENLAFLDEIFAPFDKVEVDTAIAMQPRFDKPRSKRCYYPLDSAQSLDDKSFVTLSWLVHPTKNLDETIMMTILEEALYSSAASPIQKALIDSGYGNDIFPAAAYDTDLQEGVLTFGLRACKNEHLTKVEGLIIDTLKALVKDGIPKELIEASIHQYEFSSREIQSNFPVRLLFRVNTLWYQDGDPKAYLMFDREIKKLRKKMEENPRLFEELIEKKLLHNPHRYTQILEPSHKLSEKKEAAFQEKMAKTQDSLSETELHHIKEQAAALQKESEEPDSAEALATIPKVALCDIPKKLDDIPGEISKHKETTILAHPDYTNGVSYLGLAIDTEGLDMESLMYMPLFAKAMTGMGAGSYSYEEMAQKLMLNSGGFHSDFSAGHRVDDDALFQHFTIDGKYLESKSDVFFDILCLLIEDIRFDNVKRLKDLLLELYSERESDLVSSGHFFAIEKAASSLTRASYLHHKWQGIDQIIFLKELIADFDKKADQIIEKLRSLHKILFTQKRITASLVASKQTLSNEKQKLLTLIDSLPEGETINASTWLLEDTQERSGIAISTDVNFSATAFSMPKLNSGYAPALRLLSNYISSKLLYTKLRLIGGAYGGFSYYDDIPGMMFMASYRDPHIVSTIETFKTIPKELKESFTPETLEEVRLSTIADTDVARTPWAKGASARKRYLSGYSLSDLERNREMLFSIQYENVAPLIEELFETRLESAPIAVVSNSKALKEVSNRLKLQLTLMDM